MKEKEDIVNINFFKKVWYSITKFEQYPAMATEGLKRAIKYLIILTAIVTIFVTIGSLLQTKSLIGEFAKYVQDNIPEFTYKDGVLNMQSDQVIIIKDNIESSGIDKIVIDTISETTEQKEQIEINNLIEGNAIFFFKDQILLKSKLEENQIVRQELSYNDFLTSLLGDNINEFNKEQFTEHLTSEKMLEFYAKYGLVMFLYMLLVSIIISLLDSFEIAILGWITTTIAGIRMKFVAIYNMAVYALTLPMILNIIYIVINYFTNFTITYFQIGYITIAYIYLAATIFIIKDDLIKKMQEVQDIKKEQENVRKEIEEESET